MRGLLSRRKEKRAARGGVGREQAPKEEGSQVSSSPPQAHSSQSG